MKNKISLYLSTVLLFSSVAYANYWSEPSQNIIKSEKEKTQKHITVDSKQFNILGFQVNNSVAILDLTKDLHKYHGVNTIKFGFSFAKYDDYNSGDKKDYITEAVKYVKLVNDEINGTLKVIIDLNVDPCAKDYTDGLLDSFKGCYQNSLDDFWEKRDGKYGKPSSYDRYLEFVSAVVEANKEESIVIGYNIMSAPGKTTADMDALLYLLTNKDARKDFPLLNNKSVGMTGKFIKNSINYVAGLINYHYNMYKSLKPKHWWSWKVARKAWHFSLYLTTKLGAWVAGNKTMLSAILSIGQGENNSKIIQYISNYAGSISSLMLHAKSTGKKKVSTSSIHYGKKGLIYLKEFESKKLTNFYKEAIKRIQKIDKTKWIFIAPNQIANSFGIKTKLKIDALKIDKVKLAYMPKLSQLSTVVFNGFDYFSTFVEIENSNISRIVNNLLNIFADKISIDLFKQSKFDDFFKNWINRQANLGLPVVLGGFGGNIKPFAKPLGDDMDAPENIFTRLSGKYLSRIMKLSKESNIGTIYQVDTKFFQRDAYETTHKETIEDLKKYPKMFALTPTDIYVVSVDGEITERLKYDADKKEYTLKYKAAKNASEIIFYIPPTYAKSGENIYYYIEYDGGSVGNNVVVDDSHHITIKNGDQDKVNTLKMRKSKKY